MTRKIGLQKKRDKKAKKRKKKVKVFFVYTDYTTEKVPRPFYTGKGLERRVKDTEQRSKYWKHIATKYGWERVIVLRTKSEAYAFKTEIRLIRKHKTFAADWEDGSGWGANLTRGGEGSSGIKQSKALIEKRLKNTRGENHWLFGKGHTEEAKRKMSEKNSGEGNARVLLVATDIPTIRRMWTTVNYTIPQLAERYGVSEGCITQIVYNYTWKIPEEEHLALQAARKINTDRIEAKIAERNELIRQEYPIVKSCLKLGKKYGLDPSTIMVIVKAKP